ncbi:MAG TPA: HAMP domain-containing sensor histidine kinase [Vicinamibacterales bacterium]|nr:HAMP domain-containing sensor histidine kinase [Vicinamibacterales bacterium]
MNRFIHDRGVRLAAGLAVVVAIPMAVLFYFQFKSLKDIETTSAVVLRQLSSETADSLTRAIEDYLKRPHISVLLRITQGRTEPIDMPFIEPILNDALAESPFVESFFLWTEVGPQANKWLVFDQSSKALPSGASERFREDKVLGDRLLRRLRELVKTKRAIVAFTETINGRPHYFQAQLRWEGPARERMTSVIAFAVDAEKLRTEYIPQVLRDWLASVQQPSGFPHLETEVLDETGEHIYASHPERSGHVTPVDERSFAIIFFDKELLEFAAPYEQHREIWGLRTSYGPQQISEIVSASTRPQQALMIVLAASIALGVFLVAGAAAREVRVAELKSNFVASVSHDLKTPLALIQLFAETLELGRVRTPERAQEYYRIINGESKKLTRLIENILDFSRMEAGLRPYRMEPADLGESLNKVLARMELQFAQGNFTITPKIQPDLPRILADQGAAEQAIENLLANAMKYSGEAKTIEIEAKRAGGHIVVSVTDHGIGISRREQGRIFRKFYRVERELGGGPQGTGLGLAIVDHTMRGHGGFVRVESEPERGSTFSLHFPVPKENAFHGTLATEGR